MPNNTGDQLFLSLTRISCPTSSWAWSVSSMLGFPRNLSLSPSHLVKWVHAQGFSGYFYLIQISIALLRSELLSLLNQLPASGLGSSPFIFHMFPL